MRLDDGCMRIHHAEECLLKRQPAPKPFKRAIVSGTGRRAHLRRRCHCTALFNGFSGTSDRTVRVEVEDSIYHPVTEIQSSECTLGAYMSLPVSQFVLIELPMGGKLQRTGPDVFQILVPRIELVGVWLKPIVSCTVRNDAGFVDIQSQDFRIETSREMEFLGLDKCVDFCVQCQIRHREWPEPQLHCTSQIQAIVDPPPFFSYVPKEVLSGTASLVLKSTLAALHGTFLPSLGRDYERWATSRHYREQRRQHAITSDAALFKH